MNDPLTGTTFNDLEWSLTEISIGHAIIWCWLSEKWYETEALLQWTTNRYLHMRYSRVSCQMTLSDLATYSMTRNITRRPLCDVSCHWIFRGVSATYSRAACYYLPAHAGDAVRDDCQIKQSRRHIVLLARCNDLIVVNPFFRHFACRLCLCRALNTTDNPKTNRQNCLKLHVR